MASIEKRINKNEITYRVKIRLKGQSTQTATFHRLTDARRWAQQTESDELAEWIKLFFRVKKTQQKEILEGLILYVDDKTL